MNRPRMVEKSAEEMKKDRITVLENELSLVTLRLSQTSEELVRVREEETKKRESLSSKLSEVSNRLSEVSDVLIEVREKMASQEEKIESQRTALTIAERKNAMLRRELETISTRLRCPATPAPSSSLKRKRATRVVHRDRVVRRRPLKKPFESDFVALPSPPPSLQVQIPPQVIPPPPPQSPPSTPSPAAPPTPSAPLLNQPKESSPVEVVKVPRKRQRGCRAGKRVQAAKARAARRAAA